MLLGRGSIPVLFGLYCTSVFMRSPKNTNQTQCYITESWPHNYINIIREYTEAVAHDNCKLL